MWVVCLFCYAPPILDITPVAQILPAITEAYGPSGELDMSGASNALGEIGAGQALAAEAVFTVASIELAEAIELLGQDAWYSYPGYPPL